ncbi:hypothetical protein [Marinobacter sp.]|uniref:hypothetical protein n=1 Tax=Marinobacter sp. TaxID=50741 RepID=UPI002B26D981|nr:hypothetical protein [Marinobacter sp.]
MPIWVQLAIQVAVTVLTVGVVLAGFWYLIVRPWLSQKVQELIDAVEEIEPKVTRGVHQGVKDAAREAPQRAWEGATKDPARQFMKFGSDLFENGLSSFLGGAADMQKSAASESEPENTSDTREPRHRS